MTSVVLRPTITTTASEADVDRMHSEAKDMCVLRASVNFRIHIESVTVLPDATIN
jgi:organic hydroperoxide reductase OsmC/OhrA